jgi:hypothetical protein
MQVNEQMIQAAAQKAKELRVLPRKDQPEDIATNNEIMASILEAAVNASLVTSSAKQRKEQDEGGTDEHNGLMS